jgi:RsiW-degrading membrane proteinase PrsW (M82 family)
MQTLLYVTLLVSATFIWGYLFYKKDYHPQPLKVILQSFVMGLFAMIPVFAYKGIYQKFLPTLAEYAIFQPILNSPILIGATVFLFNLITLSLLLFALSGIISTALNFLNHNILTNLKNAIKTEPLGFVAVSLMLGAVIFLESLAQKTLNIPILGTILGTVLFLAIIEEYIKHLMVRITDDKKLRDIDDAITLSIVVGLAFAFVETLIYALAVGEIQIIFYRTLISIPIHIVASGIFGYYYGVAHFSKAIVSTEGGEKIYGKNWLPRILNLKKSVLFHEEKIIEGIFFATAFHAIMNLLFEFGLGFLAVPCIAIGFVIVFKFYKLGQYESNLLLVALKQKHQRALAGAKVKTKKA